MISIPFSVPEFRQNIDTGQVAVTIHVHRSNTVINLRSVSSWDIRGINIDVGITRPIKASIPLRNASVVADGNEVFLRMNNSTIATLRLGTSINIHINVLPGVDSFNIPYSMIKDIISSSGLVRPVMEYLNSIADIDMIIDVMNRYSDFIEPIINSAMNDPTIRRIYGHILDNIQVMPTMTGGSGCSCGR